MQNTLGWALFLDLFMLESIGQSAPQLQEIRRKGELLGEAAFFFRLHHINTAVVAEGSTTLFLLLYDDYHQLCSTYVKDAAAVMETIIDLVNDAGKAGKSQGSAASAGSGITDQGALHAPVRCYMSACLLDMTSCTCTCRQPHASAQRNVAHLLRLSCGTSQWGSVYLTLAARVTTCRKNPVNLIRSCRCFRSAQGSCQDIGCCEAAQ
jgi:hypothetical protein